MKGGEGDDRIEALIRRFPCLKVGVDDLGVREISELLAGTGGQPLTKFNADDLVTASGQRQSGLSRARTNLKQPGMLR